MPNTRRPGNRVSRFALPSHTGRLTRAVSFRLPMPAEPALAGQGPAFSLRRRLAGALLALFLVLAVGGVPAAQAQIGSARYASIVIDAANGNVLSQVNADEPRHPASLTKLMTLYMVFEALRDHRIGLYQYVPVSGHAASMMPSKLGLMPGTRITVQQAILGLVTKSANDAAAALGEMLGGGSEERFAQMMTLRARGLGMTRSVFRNASGVPDPEQISSAHDMAVLARRLVIDFPNEYRYFSTPSFVWHGRTIPNHDNMLRSYPGADGLKTGYVDASGHNLVTSAVRGGVRLVGVVFGASSNGTRDLHMTALLNQGFARMDVPTEGGRGVVRTAARAPALVASAAAAPPPAPPAVSSPGAATRAVPRWSVQLGAFSREAAARQTLAQARRLADEGTGRIEPVTVRRRTTAWRVLMIGLTPVEARQTCQTLARHRMACTPIRPEGGQIASR